MKKILNHKKLIAVALLGLIGSPLSAATGSTTPLGLSDFATLCVLLGLIIVQFIIIAVLANSVQAIVKLKRFKEEANKISGILVIAIMTTLALYPESLFAANEGGEAFYTMSSGTFWLLVSINIVLLVVILYLFGLFKSVVRVLQGKRDEEGVTEAITSGLTDAVPLEREEEIMLDHEYDGIRELDNNLPPWWVGLFWVTIIFSVVYIVHFHITGTGDLQIEEFKKEMAEGEKIRKAYQASQANKIDEENVKVLTDNSALAKGKELYMANCVACHGDKGQGGVGPNLTDQYWIHGGSMSDIFKTIKYGVPAKGMIPWQQQLSMGEIHKVASYVNTLKGTEVENGKEPQGDLYQPENESGKEEGSEKEEAEESGSGKGTEQDTLSEPEK